LENEADTGAADRAAMLDGVMLQGMSMLQK